jgi:streptomycin 6-kinase
LTSAPDQRQRDAAFVTPAIAGRWLNHHGRIARRWLDDLPRLTRELEARWDLKVAAPLEGGSVSVVLAVDSRAGPAVLKLAPPWSLCCADEALALRAWDGAAAPTVLNACPDGRALLLERVRPGLAAQGLSSDELADLVRMLQAPTPPPGLATIADAVDDRFNRALENRHRLLNPAQLHRARTTALAMARSRAERVSIVHGDLLAKNILRSDRAGLLAIDPNPCIGDPAFDPALWALAEEPVSQALARAAALAPLLELSKTRILAWIETLAAAEICLAPLSRARATLNFAREHRARWL